MRNPVPKLQGLLQRIAPEVEITVFCAQVLAAVALVFDREGRGEALVEDVDAGYADFYVTGRHLGVLAAALDNFALHLDHIFASEGGCSFHKLGGSVRFHNQLGNAVAVAQVDECHAAEFTGALHPPGKGHSLSYITNAEFSAGIRSVHCYILYALIFY